MEKSSSLEEVRCGLQTVGGYQNNAVDGELLRSQLDMDFASSYFGVMPEGYSVILPEKLSTTTKWNVYRSARSPLKLVDSFPQHPQIRTLHDNFEHAVTSYGDFRYLGTRVRMDGTLGEYKWMTYAEAGSARSEIGSGLLFHGVLPGSSIGLYLVNRAEWVVVDHACCSFSYVSIPLYDTLGPDAVRYIINHAEISVVFCSVENLKALLRYISELPTLRLIVLIGISRREFDEIPCKSYDGVQIISYCELQEQGRCNLQQFRPPMAEDVATICYTSGSTGTPKGVVLTHANLIASVAGFCVDIQFFSTDVYISYLPLAHIYERMLTVALTHVGSAIGYYRGDTSKLMEDIAVLRPTIFASVPRIYNKIYSAISKSINTSGSITQKLFNMAFNARKDALMYGGSKVSTPLWDWLVFNKIRAKLGGRVRFMMCGSSPISPKVVEFLRICLGGRFKEAYGMTETSCVSCSCDDGDNMSGHVGSPNPACEIKLVDVPEMEYTGDDKPYPRGEICMRGPIVFKGYYKDELQTSETIDEHGWLHSGDIGLWLPGGRLKIIDRKKNIFKLAQGEYIAPEKIENVYVRSKFVSQCFIHGDSLESRLVAVVVLETDVAKEWATSEGIKFEDINKLCRDPKARGAVLADMNDVAREAQLRGFEFAKAVTLVAEPFSLENGLLTPTFKIKRHQAKAHFADAISRMYSELAFEE